jgi:hypothetical protein
MSITKKSQISIFYILGIVLLISVSSAIVILNRSSIVETVSIDNTKYDSFSMISLVEGCIISTRPTIKEITRNAGELVISRPPLMYDGVKYNYWCTYSSDQGCKNRVFSKLKLEQELNLRLKPVIDTCINFSNYEDAGYSIFKGISSVETAVSSDEIMVYLTLPLTITRGDSVIEHSEFSYKFSIYVGRMFEVANMILNEEIMNNHFDKDDWMKTHGAEFIIEKYRPYPDIVYSLTRIDPITQEWLELNFAIQGVDTTSNPTKIFREIPLGWCKEGDLCFFNPESHLCDGNFFGSMPDNCKNVSSELYPICEGSECKSCGPHQHGDEWCEFEGPTGEGRDFPGTRHYKISCINGMILTEPCRDYRDELCTSIGNEAICRPNRWKTCTQQQTKISCEDTSKRDCMWAEVVKNDFSKPDRYGGNARTYCVPQVPPGFMKGSSAAFDVCRLPNEWMDCIGVKCPFVWSETSMIQCSRMGDCGKGYNIGGGLSNFSFLTTDVLDNPNGPSINLLLGPEHIGRSHYTLSLPPLNYVTETYTSDVFSCTDCTIDHIIVRIEEYIDYLMSLSVSRLIRQYIFEGKISIKTRHFTYCMPFMTQDMGDCGLCHDPFKPCTKYRCENLGSNCVFFVNPYGYGTCISHTSTADQPIIYLNTMEVDGYTSGVDIFASTIFGISLDDEIPPFSPFVLRFETSKPARCSVTPLPMMDFDIPVAMHASLFSSSQEGYNTSHEMILYALPPEYFDMIIDGITEYHQALNMLQIDYIDQEIDKLIEELTEIANDLSNVPGVGSDDIDSFVAELEEFRTYYNTEIRPVTEENLNSFNEFLTAYLYSISVNEVYQFIRCSDANGNLNQDDIFIKYAVGIDNEPPYTLFPPEIHNDVAHNPFINLEVYMNEASECRADVGFGDKIYEEMPHEMDCSMNLFAPQRGYKCTIDIPKTSAYCYGTGEGVLRFRCRDQIYLTNITESNINQVSFFKTFSHNC